MVAFAVGLAGDRSPRCPRGRCAGVRPESSGALRGEEFSGDELSESSREPAGESPVRGDAKVPGSEAPGGGRDADLILIDEIGFAPMDPTGAELFFRLVAAAYERRSLGIGSHWPFEL